MKERIDSNEYASKAKKLFLDGYNCSQAVALAFNDLMKMDEKTLICLSSSFGGGMGRLREVCGAVTGAFMVLGVLYGFDKSDKRDKKGEHYERIQEFAHKFGKENGSYICRDLLGLSEEEKDFRPSERTKEYYNNRPCPDKVYNAAFLLAEYINNN